MNEIVKLLVIFSAAVLAVCQPLWIPQASGRIFQLGQTDCDFPARRAYRPGRLKKHVDFLPRGIALAAHDLFWANNGAFAADEEE